MPGMWVIVDKFKRGAQRVMHLSGSESTDSNDRPNSENGRPDARRDALGDARRLSRGTNSKQHRQPISLPISPRIGSRRGSSRDIFTHDPTSPPPTLPLRNRTFILNSEDILKASPAHDGTPSGDDQGLLPPQLGMANSNLDSFDWGADVKMTLVESPTAPKEAEFALPRCVNAFEDEVASKDGADDGTEKQVNICHGALNIPVRAGGYSRAGWSTRPGTNGCEAGVRKQNQDSYCVQGPFSDRPDEIFVSVFDGHGAEGRRVSQFVRDTLPGNTVTKYKARKAERLAEKPAGSGPHEIYDAELRKAALKFSFMNAEENLKGTMSNSQHQFSGTTGVGVWLVGQSAYAACTGDSRAIVGRVGLPSQTYRMPPREKGSQTDVYGVALTYDQKPTRTDERKRVRAAGARVTRWKKNVGPLRVWLPDDWIPGLAMTRSIGDTILTEFGVTPEPEVTVTGLGPQDSFVVVASDGVWEFMTSNEVALLVWKERNSGATPSVAASRLVEEAVRRWNLQEIMVDDITAVILFLDFQKQDTEAPDQPHFVLDDGTLTPLIIRHSEEKPSI